MQYIFKEKKKVKCIHDYIKILQHINMFLGTVSVLYALRIGIYPRLLCNELNRLYANIHQFRIP